MSEGGSVLNSLKVKLLEEQRELQQLRLNLEQCQEELKVEKEKRTEVNSTYVVVGYVDYTGLGICCKVALVVNAIVCGI